MDKESERQQDWLDELLDNYKTAVLHNFTCKKNDCYEVGEGDPHFGTPKAETRKAVLAHLEAAKREALQIHIQDLRYFLSEWPTLTLEDGSKAIRQEHIEHRLQIAEKRLAHLSPIKQEEQ